MTGKNSFNWDHIFNSIKDSIILLDSNGIIKDCNVAFLKLVEKSRRQIIGVDGSTFFTDKDGRPEDCPFLKSKKTKKRESLIINKFNKWLKADIDPILDENNKISGFVHIMSDITEHIEADISLQGSEEKFRTLTENISVGIYRNTVGAKGKFIEANPAIVKMFGFKNKKEFLAYNVSELYLHPQERKFFNDGMLKKGFVKNEELQLKKVDGTTFFGSISAEAIKDKNGKVQFYDGIIEDITERKKAEKALLMSEKKYRNLFEKSKDAILIIHNSKFVDCNQATINMLCYNSKEEFLNTHPSELSPEKQPDGKTSFQKANKMMKIAFENGSHRFEWYHKKSNGEIFPVEVLLTSISSNKKNQIYHTVWRDITERKLAEEALKKQNLEYQTLLLNLGGMVYRCKNDKNWTMEFISAGCLSLTGYKQDDLLNNNKLSYNELILPEYQDHLWKKWQEKLKIREPVEDEYEIRTATGDIKWVWEKGRGIFDKTGQLTHLEGLITDITERKLVEKALAISEESLRALFNAMTDVVLELDHEGRYVNIAPTSPDLLYKAQAEMLGKTLHDLFPLKEADKFLAAIHESLDKNIIVNIEYQLELKNKLVWFEARIAPKTKNTVLFIAHDITERKRARQIQEVIYNISNTAASTDDLEELISLIHKELGTMIDTTNFYIALYNEKKEMFSLPFFTDAQDKTITFPAGKTLTNYVRKTQKSLLANKKVKVELEKSGDIELFGIDSKIWLGVPLKIEGKIIGVLAVQSYTDELAYTKSDLKMLEFVSNQVSISIERKRVEIALQENERRYKYLFNQSPTSIWEEDFSEVHKYLISLKKSGIKDFKEYFENHLDEVKKCSEMVRVLDINEMTIKLFNAKNKEELITNLGSIFTEDSLLPFIDQLCAIAEGHTRYTGETINKTLDGKSLNVFIKSNVVPGYEKDYSRILISLIDVTGQKKAEEDLRNGRERLKMLNKIIRHDIANDFIVIKSAINIYRRASDAKMIDEIEKRVDKSLNTIDNYRKYESFIDLNQDLYELEIADILNDIIAEFPKIKFNIQGNCKVFADNALDSVFTNLITNSIKHGNSTKIDIKISLEDNMCKINFIDNGTGIPDKIKGKIFDEGFFHGKAGHTGIGLHIIKQTIERYGGSISIEDNKPRGAVFIINLKKAL